MTNSSRAVERPPYRIEGPQTIADVERELAEIETQRPLCLSVPVKLDKWWFGGEAALIQLLITWGRRQDDAILVTHIQQSQDPSTQLRRLVRRPFGLVAVWMARDVTDVTRTHALKVSANSASDTAIDLMWHGRRKQHTSSQPTLWGDVTEDLEDPEVASVGTCVFLASIDHHPRWRLPPFYFPTGEVRHRDDFIALAASIAKQATSVTGGSPLTRDLLPPMGSILYELFKNTDEWAKTDADGVPLLRSMRGMLAQGHSWKEQEMLDVAARSPALNAYLRGPEVRSSDRLWRFLELSVLDSGPGLARRWLAGHPRGVADSANPTPEEEYRACIECFLRWNSSTRAGHKGVGLYEVMRALSHLGGFFKVRTGRLSLYRDFVARPYTESSKEDCSLDDWTTRSSSLTALAPTEGVLYTMLIPIGRRSD